MAIGNVRDDLQNVANPYWNAANLGAWTTVGTIVDPAGANRAIWVANGRVDRAVGREPIVLHSLSQFPNNEGDRLRMYVFGSPVTGVSASALECCGV